MRGRRYRTNSVFSVAKHLFSCRLSGVVLYVLLCGFCPFFDECILAAFASITSGNYSFPSPPWDSISEVCPSQVTLVHGFALHANQCASAFW